MAGVVEDVMQTLTEMSMQRMPFEPYWQQAADVAAPEVRGDFRFSGPGLGGSGASGIFPYQPVAAQRSKKLYDGTAIDAVDRLASGIEALVIPQSEYWHGLGITDLVHDDDRTTDREKKWFEKQRNLLFKVRYDADSGWITAAQTALRRCIVFGNAFIWTEEGFDKTALVNYQFLPLNECYISEDPRGRIVCFYRYYEMTAEQALMKFGARLPPKLQQAAQHPVDKLKRFKFVQAIRPRADYSMNVGDGVMLAQWASLHIAVDEKAVVGEKGFFEFPVIDFRWLPEPGCPWADGPIMKVLSDVQSLQLMARNEQTAGEQAIRPPLLTAHSGITNRPNSAPGAMTVGGLNMQGQRLVEPLFNGQRLDFATMVLEAKRNQIKNSLYLNLFALLVQSPQMSATEALLRANEKGELLGPCGARLQQSLSRMIDREMNILKRRGLYGPESAYRVPPTLQDKNIAPQMTGPIDRLRRAKEGEGIVRLLEIAAPLGAADPEVMDNFNADGTLRNLREIFGAPVDTLLPPEQVQEKRARRQAVQAAAQSAAIAKDMAAASKQGTDALAGMKEAGFI